MMFERAIIVFLDDLISFDKFGSMSFHPQLPGFMRDLSATQGRIMVFITDPKMSQEKLHPLLKEARFPDLVYFHLGDAQKIWELRGRYNLDFKRCLLAGKISREGFAQEFNMKFQELDQNLTT